MIEILERCHGELSIQIAPFDINHNSDLNRLMIQVYEMLSVCRIIPNEVVINDD